MLSLSMIVKNEEKYLRACLESVKDVVDEIVIVDTGSIDNTLKIAEEYNSRIFSFTWVDDFSAARNFALSKTSGNWILYLDADERLNEKSKTELKSLISADGKSGVQCIVNSIDEQKEQPQIMKYIRLFNKSDSIAFEGRVHEQIEQSLIKNEYKIIDSEIEIIHIGYNATPGELNAKGRRNLDLLKKEYDKNSSSYYAYQLANTFSLLEEPDEARVHYLLALKDVKLLPEYRVYSYMYLADYELAQGRIDEAEKYIHLGENENPDDVLLNLIASQVYLRKNQIQEAINYCKKALTQNNKLSDKKNYSKILNIIIKPEKIICHGLYMSLISGDNISFNGFMNELKQKAGVIPESLIPVLVSFIEALIINQDITDKQIKTYSRVIDDNNLLLALALLRSYEVKDKAEKILEAMKEKFINNSKFLSAYGLILFEMKKYNNAEEILKKGITVKEKDPAAFFYLISLYVQQQKFDEISKIVEMAEIEFKDMPELKQKIDLLKRKLSTLTN